MIENKKNIVLLFDDFQKIHFYKDPGMILHYLNKLYGYNVECITISRSSKDEIEYINGLKVIRIKRHIFNPFIFYLLKNSKKIDLLILFHNKRINYFYRKIYKILNPRGKVYLKLDMNMINLKEIELFYMANKKVKFLSEIKNGFVNFLKTIKRKFLYLKIKKELSGFDFISVETRCIYERLKEILEIKKLYYIPNGFDDFSKNVPEVLPFDKKENIIITVGRIGSPPKNNTMLLNALGKVNLKNWKVFFIGPVEQNFQKTIDDFYNKNKHLKEKVFFTGMIEDKKELYKWYNKSKVFCLTSLWESFAFVLLEALYFCNYILSTDIGCVRDITDNGKLGKIININDIETLIHELQNIIDGRNKIDSYFEMINERKKEFYWSKIIKKLNDIIMVNKNEE